MLTRCILNIYIALLSFTFSVVGQNNEFRKYAFERPLMGSQFIFICYASDSLRAVQTADHAFERIAELNSILSDYDPESEVSQLIRNQEIGKSYEVSDDLWYMLNASVEVAEKTDGLFDITVGNCTKLWRRAQRKKSLPSKEALASTLENTGYQHLNLDTEQQTVSFGKQDIKLDFGGIAKGYAADEAYKIFKDAGIEMTMIDAGGDIYCGKAPPGKKGWDVKVVSGLGNKDIHLCLENKAVATSGDLYRFFELDGIRYSHIVNPLTCKPVGQQIATTVISNNAEQADYLASVLNIAGISNLSSKILKKYPQAYGLVFKKKLQKIAKKCYGNKSIERLIN